MIKIAVPTKGNIVDDHFGRCETYTVFTTDKKKKIISSEILHSSQAFGSKTDIASVLQQKGVSVMLAGNMGNGAFNTLTSCGIKVYKGCLGDARMITEAFLQGEIGNSGESCKNHENKSE